MQINQERYLSVNLLNYAGMYLLSMEKIKQ